MPDFRSRNVMTGRFRTHYTECGDNGPAIVLCHGGGPGSSGEAGFAQLMPALATKFQVYALDSVGGFGETDPYYPASEGVQSRVDQLEAFMDVLCIDKAVVGETLRRLGRGEIRAAASRSGRQARAGSEQYHLRSDGAGKPRYRGHESYPCL